MKRYDVTLNTPGTGTEVYAIIYRIESETFEAAIEAALMMMVSDAWAFYNIEESKNV